LLGSREKALTVWPLFSALIVASAPVPLEAPMISNFMHGSMWFGQRRVQ